MRYTTDHKVVILINGKNNIYFFKNAEKLKP